MARLATPVLFHRTGHQRRGPEGLLYRLIAAIMPTGASCRRKLGSPAAKGALGVDAHPPPVGTGVAAGGTVVAVGGGGGAAVGGTGVAVGGTGVAVEGTGVAVGGTRVAVGGTRVAVGGTGAAVGGTRVAVGGTGVAVGGTGVAVAGGVGVGTPKKTRSKALVLPPPW